MSHSCRRRQAFTMIEIMVSLVLGVVILGIAYQLLYGSSKMNRKVEDKTEAVQSANLALESIRRDVRQLVTRPFLMSNGAFTGVVGDAQHPIMISANGTEMAFHVPDPKSPRPDPTSKKFKLTTVYYGLFKKEVAEGGHSATVYHLVRSEGTNPNVGREAGTCATGGSSNLGSIYLKEGKDADGKPLAPVQFKLLGPKMNLGTGSPTELSGDNNYYLEVRLFGCDSQAREEQPRTDLFVLDEPSRLANVPAQRVNEFTLFQPDPTPLFVAHLPPAIAGLPVDLTGPNAPPPGVGGPGRPGSNPANPNDPNNPASPGGNPNDPNNPAGPGTPGSNPPGTPGTPNANPPAGPIGPVAWVPGGPGAPPGPGTPPAGPGTPGGPPTIGLPPEGTEELGHVPDPRREQQGDRLGQRHGPPGRDDDLRHQGLQRERGQPDDPGQHAAGGGPERGQGQAQRVPQEQRHRPELGAQRSEHHAATGLYQQLTDP
ncbi:MAG: prepilin-type N-terminal cleavage/methylation domain-containing protein [Candidatus Riflebacteria bacterium]|nr:prepilin-type N-terminal cleavage/methylation domain-containing protein [Candidatus Riflebacteria bacterium]